MDKASPANFFHYNKHLKKYARQNRQSLTKSAAAMWKYCLSKKQMKGYYFRRERPILEYIVDFVCLELMLVIEVDGWSHEVEEQKQKDLIRDGVLRKVGFKILRFSSWEVLNQIDEVSGLILQAVLEIEEEMG